MIIGDRIRLLRETKKLSQGDIEKRTGLLRCYISRVENGHTVPAIETLEKLACVGGEGGDVAPLPFRVERVEGERRLA